MACVTPANPDATCHWLSQICLSPQLEKLCQSVSLHAQSVVQGSVGSSTALLAGALAGQSKRPVLLVVAHLDEADEACEDLALFGQTPWPLDVQRFSALEVLPGESNASLELLAMRLGVVRQLLHPANEKNDAVSVIVASIQALMQSVPTAQAMGEYQLELHEGQALPPASLLDWLDRAGYTRCDAIEQPGDFATRGGIIDIYPPGGEAQVAIAGQEANANGQGLQDAGPIRLDYFGDEIESIRRIDTDTMGCHQAIERIAIIGASCAQLQTDDDTTSLLSLLPTNTVVVLHEMMELAEQARGYYERLTDARGIYWPQGTFKMLTEKTHVQVNQYSSSDEPEKTLVLPLRPLPPLDHQAAKAIGELAQWQEQDDQTQIEVFCQNDAEKQRLGELLTEHAPRVKDRIHIQIGYLHRGFIWDHSADQAGKTILLPHHELFHRYFTRRSRRRKLSFGSPGAVAAGKTRDAFVEVEPGDIVVHVEHGIAHFVGLKTMTREGKTEEYLTLEFASDTLLHVPATQIDLIQKYIGGFEGKPPLSTLGGKRWAKQKQSVAEAVKQMAGQMLRIQAARASMPGIRYPADTAWSREFEAEFPYDETPDQLAAIAQIKRDMQGDQPMDRLICGDVGFGKTEVAIRAVFKAVEHGKQVAVLVPTTVLAEQHDRTFTARMADYPFTIASLSRFKSTQQQNAILKKARLGQVDIIIGTHRLLSKDVQFADLGLVIIDEEQRFGVEHKQKLLQYRLTADVLTLSATPIPRTLHMSMLGLRDISSLTTPPPDRRAVVTEVIPYDTERIKQSIIREMNREGQVFYVHNRVRSIASVADDIQKLVPDARIIVGHGQMSARELEQVMLTFTRRQADVLVCTTIIESGIDIPTANTIFIHQSDHYGLADLHQLRGRVGRYKHRAYCYLLLPPDRPITDKAAKRLKALEQYSMLGAGFKIAMRDLEIRGAGNILGAQQSGHIAAVGYEMYCLLLEQEASNLKNEKVIVPIKTHVELSIAGRFTSKYMPSDKYRMDAYRRVGRAASFETLDSVVQDLVDAYGPIPKQAQILLDIAQLRIAASLLDIGTLKVDGPDLVLRTAQPQKLEPLLGKAPGRLTVIDKNTVYYRPPKNYLEPMTLLRVLHKYLVMPQRGNEVRDA